MRDFIYLESPAEERIDTGLDLVCPEMGSANVITLVSGRMTETRSCQGTLSIKCAFEGEEIYQVEGRELAVSSSSYLVLNHGQRYASHISTTNSFETLCIFFHPGFADAVLRDLVMPDDHLLDDPAGKGRPVEFVERLYPHDHLLSPTLYGLRSALRAGRPGGGWIEEQFHLLVSRLLHVHRDLLQEIRRIPALRTTTRLEVHRRLEMAAGYMRDNYTQPLRLAQIARAACLSPHHFLRLFRSLHGLTPLQYLTQVRLERSHELLVTTDRSITDICFDVGFESPTSFSTLFRRNFGQSPVQFRRSSITKKQFSIGATAR
jgi:AraC-like DNA-binding protein